MNIKENIQVCRQFLSNILDSIIKWLPRNKRKWVFGAFGGFRDNPKYLYYQTLEQHPEIRPIWIAQNKKDVGLVREQGGEAYYYYSLKGLFHILTSKVAVCDHSLGDINRHLTGGIYYVNLWHGASVKRVRWQAPDDLVRRFHLKNKEEMRTSFRFKMLMYQAMFRVPDLCLAPSTVQAKDFFAPMMDIPLDNCIVGVYPRSQLLIKGKDAAMEFIKRHEPKETLDFVTKLKSFSKTYIYMPTWRNDQSDFIKQASINWNELNEVLRRKGELFIVKLHPFTHIDTNEVSGYSNIVLYPSDSDLYTVLPFIDCLITDYSSIYTDFLMMNKEIILFVFDYDKYVKNSYDLENFDYYFVGKRAESFTMLLDIISSDEDCHVPKEHYQRLMDYFWENNRNDIDLVEEVKKRVGY